MIGIFDSGSGGLTVVKALKERAPQADIVYFGDIRNAPYGSRSPEELIELTSRGIKRLQAFGADEIISACNSAALSVLLGAAGTSRVIDMTRPTARAMRKNAGKRVLLLATPATIASRIYADALDVIVHLDSLPIPGLASAIEFGVLESRVRSIIRDALGEKRGRAYDVVLLGCTHYPLARNVIEEEVQKLFGAIELIDPAEAVAEEAAQRFNTNGTGTMTFKISKDSRHFRDRIAQLWPETIYSVDVL